MIIYLIILFYYRKEPEPTCLIQESPKKKKGKSANTIPKESNLSEDRTKVATNVMLISQKHHCDEHEKTLLHQWLKSSTFNTTTFEHLGCFNCKILFYFA